VAVGEDQSKDVGLPRDRSAHAVQVLAQSSAECVATTLSGTSQQLSIPAGSEIVEVAALADCHIAFGVNPTATTSSPAFPKGVCVYKLLPDQTKVAVILASGASAAQFTVTRMR
jgi:hypothetical protein